MVPVVGQLESAADRGAMKNELRTAQSVHWQNMPLAMRKKVAMLVQEKDLYVQTTL